MQENCTYGLTRGQGRRLRLPALLYRAIKNFAKSGYTKLHEEGTKGHEVIVEEKNYF